MPQIRNKESIPMNKKNKMSQTVNECISAWHDTGRETDVLGSYTGFYKGAYNVDSPISTPFGPLAMAEDLIPVQDADDL